MTSSSTSAPTAGGVAFLVLASTAGSRRCLRCCSNRFRLRSAITDCGAGESKISARAEYPFQMSVDLYTVLYYNYRETVNNMNHVEFAGNPPMRY